MIQIEIPLKKPYGLSILLQAENFRFFRTYTVENSSSSLSAQQCSKVDKYQFNKNLKL